jgi:DNA-binding response OmpR family regulator
MSSIPDTVPLFKILIVDDDNGVAEFLRRQIVAWGYRAHVCADGKSALTEVSRNPYDLVLLDIFLPDVFGDELIPQFKKLQPQINVVAMTAESSFELEKKVRKQDIVFT